MLKWDKNFETKIETVDRQHRYLVDLINELNAEVVAQMEYDNYDKIMTILKELKDYTIEHFKQEEQLMKDVMGRLKEEQLAVFWPFFKNHRSEHSAFVNKVQQIYDNNIDENQEDITLELIDFLVDWLKNHMLKIDMQIPEYIGEE